MLPMATPSLIYKLVVRQVIFRGGLKVYGTHGFISRIERPQENLPT